MALNADSRSERIERVVDQISESRRRGEQVDEQAILSGNPDIADALRAALAKENFNADATDITSPTPSFADPNSAPSTIDQVHSPTRDSPPAGGGGPAASGTSSDFLRFERVRRHATGGMGEVWLARDTQIRREVALKVLKEERRKDQAIQERFLNEGHVTGALEHPGIVPVYALGVDHHGHPFYTMRFVRGESLRHAIKSFHDKRTAHQRIARSCLPFRELLGRVVDVCVTVAYAHSRGVLHRDLKPDNVMLGKFGETYVVDWGMARVLEDNAAESVVTSELITRPESFHSESGTRYGSAMGTPGFMSPEQAAGKIDELSAATDVYSLGAILYFLLTNHVSIAAESLDEFLRRVEAGDYVPPLTLNPGAPKELAAVCAKAMAADPRQRYRTARELADDLDRWLADEALSGVPESWTQRAARFSRRNLRVLAPVTAATAIVAVTAVVAATQIERSRQRAASAAEAEEAARVRADQNFLQARNTVDQWLTGFSTALTGYEPTLADFRERMLEQAAREYEKFVAQASDDPVVQLEAGRTYLRLGDIRRQLRSPEQALAAYRSALGIFEALAKSSADFQARQGFAQAQGRTALALGDQGEFAQALAAHERAIAALAENPEAVDAPQRTEYEATLSDLEINHASALARQGDMRAARELFARVVERLQSLTRVDPGRLETRVSLATGLIGLGQVTTQLGDSARAREYFRQAAEYFEAAAKLGDDTPRYLMLAADTNLLLATVEGKLGNFTAEAKTYRQLIGAYEQLNSQLPNSPTFLEREGMTRVDLGQVLMLAGGGDAERELRTAESTFAKLKAEYPSVPRFHEEHGLALDILGNALANRGAAGEAQRVARAALDELTALSDAFPDVIPYHLRAATCQSHLAQHLAVDGKFDEALEQFDAALERLDASLGKQADDPGLVYAAAVAASRRGETHFLAGKLDEAGAAADAADKHWQRLRTLTSDAEYLAAAAWHYAMFPVAEKRSAERAVEYAAAAVEQAPDNPYYGALAALADLQHGRAAECLERLKALRLDGDTPFADGVSRYVAALAHAAAKQRNDAQRALDDAIKFADSAQAGRWELRALQRRAREEAGSKPSAGDATPGK